MQSQVPLRTVGLDGFGGVNSAAGLFSTTFDKRKMPPLKGRILLTESVLSSDGKNRGPLDAASLQPKTPGQHWETGEVALGLGQTILSSGIACPPQLPSSKFGIKNRGLELHKRNLSNLTMKPKAEAKAKTPTQSRVVREISDQLFEQTLPLKSAFNERSHSLVNQATLSAYTPIKNLDSGAILAS